MRSSNDEILTALHKHHSSIESRFILSISSHAGSNHSIADTVSARALCNSYYDPVCILTAKSTHSGCTTFRRYCCPQTSIPHATDGVTFQALSLVLVNTHMAQDVCQPPSNDAIRAHERTIPEHRSLWSPLRRWFGREGKDGGTLPPGADLEGIHRSGVVRRISRKVVPGLPRPGTFRRQQSELRDNLEPVKSPPEERRTVSVDRRGYAPARDILGRGTSPSPRTSAPVFMENVDTGSHEPVWKRDVAKTQVSEVAMHDASITHAAPESVSLVDEQRSEDNGSEDGFLDELDRTWILNLSMHFRDRSNREKFFVTYAETAIRWRRVTISLDYRNAPPGSLEDELQKTRFQRDKSARIYESIRDSLCDIQFYDTVTNLKLQTEADRLHVHVTEDIHEVIHYPPVSAIAHLHCPRYREEEVNFDGHLSGFVYKVKVHNQVLIKKEIPGPDTVEEFLYEINALHCLSGSASVIQFGGVIVDNEEKLLKGLLISYAKQGALVDVLFDNKGDLPWQRRERWAKQVVQGLSEVHEGNRSENLLLTWLLTSVQPVSSKETSLSLT